MLARLALRIAPAIAGAALLLFLAPAAPVSAAEVSLSPVRGGPGTEISVSGRGFAPAHLVSISAAGLNLNTTTTSNSSGNFEAVRLGIVPAMPRGNYKVTVTDGTRTISASFTLIPVITVSPDNGIVGDQVYLSGESFSRNARVYFYWDDATTPIATAQSNIMGGVSAVQVTIPSSQRGLHSIKASEAQGGTTEAVSFTLFSMLSVNPASAIPGDILSLNGTGFAAKHIIKVTIDGSSTSTIPPSIISNSRGEFVANLTVPYLSYGTHFIEAVDYLGFARVDLDIRPRINITPTSSIPGGNITVTGSGFAADQFITLMLDNSVLQDTTPPQIKTDTGGIFNAALSVPAMPAGQHALSARAGASVNASINLNIVPGISMNPTGGTVGSPVILAGAGFAPNSLISIYWDSNTKINNTASTDSSGSFSNLTISIPPGASGHHSLMLQDTNGNKTSQDLIITPGISMNGDSTKCADIITLQGSGFAAGKLVIVSLGSNETAPGMAEKILATPISDAVTGDFTVSFSVPVLPGGIYMLKAEDSEHNMAQSALTVKPGITVTPTSGGTGPGLNITGSGFTPGKSVTIKFNGVAASTNPELLTPDDRGMFTTALVLPPSPAGTYVITATDGTASAETIFAIVPQASINPVTSLSSPGYVDMDIVITGSGFTASMPVTLTLDGLPLDINAKSDAGGLFQISMGVPACSAGKHVIRVSDGNTTQELEFFMESQAPKPPVPVTPKNGSYTGQMVRFAWKKIKDASGTSYTLQISTRVDFSDVVIQKSGLADDHYDMPAEEKLKTEGLRSTYYWRVQATDGADNRGDWSPVQTFYIIGSFSANWMIYISMIALAVVFLAWLVWIIRKRGYS